MRKWHLAQLGLFLSGTLFAFYTVVVDFLRFYAEEGTIFKIQDCVYPNPVTTPCFYGAFGFLFGLILSYKAFRASEQRRFTWIRRTFFLALAGTLFAWSNFALSAYKFYVLDTNTGCSGVPTQSPLLTPCFIGATIFLFALLVSTVIYRKGVKSTLTES